MKWRRMFWMVWCCGWMPAAVAGTDGDPVAAAQTLMDKPVAAVVEKMDRAMFPEGKKETYFSTEVKMKVTVPLQQMAMEVTTLYKAPDKMLSTLRVANLMDIKQGYDGRIGWMSTAGLGVQQLSGKMLDEMKFQVKFGNPALSLNDIFTRIAMAPDKEKINGHNCYRLICEMPPDSGIAPYTLWVDDQSYRVVRMKLTAQSPNGPVEAVNDMEEYGTFDGVVMPVKFTSRMLNIETQTTVVSCKFNVPMDDALFAMPSEDETLEFDFSSED